MNVQTHWEKIYREKSPEAVSWYRPHLETSLEIIERIARQRSASIIDVGGGESTLVDDLLAQGYQNIAVLDVSQTAIEVISTFGPEGPTKCSGLEVVRYDAESLHAEFGVRFLLLDSFKELHGTPFGTTQQFLYCLCRTPMKERAAGGMATSQLRSRAGGMFSPQTVNFLKCRFVQASAAGFFRYRFTTASAAR
jgi:hypothetical protein